MSEDLTILVEDKEQLISKFEEFIGSLPADTKSVQLCAYAYTDTYDDYSDKSTKCVAEMDAWYNLSEEVRMSLLADAVTVTLAHLKEWAAVPTDNEQDMLERAQLFASLGTMLKTLARSFVLYIENVDTASVAEEQLEKLFSAVLSYKDKELFNLAFSIFRKKKALEAKMEELRWNLMTKAAAPVKPKTSAPAKPKPVTKPATTSTAKTASSDQSKPATSPQTAPKQEPKVNTPIA